MLMRKFIRILTGIGEHMNFEKVRNILVKILLGTLVAAAAVAVSVILIGAVGDIMWRVIGTLAAAVGYVLVLLATISTVPQINEGPEGRSALFLVNSLLALVCASYLTSILGIWGVTDGELSTKLHLAYFVILLGIFYAKPLITLEQTNPRLKRFIRANYIFIALACVLASIAIVAPTEWSLWDSFFGRSVAAAVVIDVTLSMIITVLYHLDTQQLRKSKPNGTLAANTTRTNNEAEATTPQQSNSTAPTPIWKAVLIVLFAVFVGIPVLMGVLGAVLMSMRL